MIMTAAINNRALLTIAGGTAVPAFRLPQMRKGMA